MRSVVAKCGAVFGAVLLSANAAYGISSFPAKIPNVDEVPGISGIDCNVCHNPGAQNAGNLNVFGTQFRDLNIPVYGTGSVNRLNWTWSSTVASANADGDAFTNGQELQDPDGSSVGGTPGDPALVRNPADVASIPPVISAEPSARDISVTQFSSPADSTFTVTNTGGAGGFSPGASDDQPWLSESLTGGSGVITFSTAALSVGNYTATITVAQTGVFNTDTVQVNLEVTTACGNSSLNPGEDCDPGADSGTDCCSADCQFVAASTLCRESEDAECDTADFCSGSSATCPQTFTPDGTSCTGCGPSHCSAGQCNSDAAVCLDGIVQCTEDCDAGAVDLVNDCCSGTCHFETPGTVCRPADGVCDLADTCLGASATCGADAVRANGSLCRAIAPGGCDVAENCDGLAKTCPADGFRSAGDVCRPEDKSNCDVAEACTGSSVACPADGFEPEGTYCSQEEVCSSEGACVDPEPVTQSKTQARCLGKWNAGAASAAGAYAKQVNGCTSTAFKLKLGGDLDACVEVPSGKTTTAIRKADAAARAKCAEEPPDFGTNPAANLEELAAGAVAGAYGDLFGDTLEGTIPSLTGSTASCQKIVTKSFSKCLAGKFRSFALCSKKGLKGKSASIDTFVELQSCLEFEDNSTHFNCALDERSKTRKSLEQKCPTDVAALGAAFPGCLASEGDDQLDRDDLYACYRRSAACRSCQALKTWDNLARDCDVLDDGVSNDSCE